MENPVKSLVKWSGSHTIRWLAKSLRAWVSQEISKNPGFCPGCKGKGRRLHSASFFR